MLGWQADDVLPRWTLNYLGAIKIHVQRTQFIFGIFNTLSLAITVYYNSPLPGLQLPLVGRPFTTIYGWVAVVLTIGLVFFAGDRTILYPAEVSYNSHQASRRDRNPGYALTAENHETLERLETKLLDDERNDE